MDIMEALKSEICIRVTCNNKWLIYDNDKWVVYGRNFGQRKTRKLIETDKQDLAIEKLLKV